MSPLAVTLVGIPLHGQPPGRRTFSFGITRANFIGASSSQRSSWRHRRIQGRGGEWNERGMVQFHGHYIVQIWNQDGVFSPRYPLCRGGSIIDRDRQVVVDLANQSSSKLLPVTCQVTSLFAALSRTAIMPGSYPGSELSVDQLVHALVQTVDLTSPAWR